MTLETVSGIFLFIYQKALLYDLCSIIRNWWSKSQVCGSVSLLNNQIHHLKYTVMNEMSILQKYILVSYTCQVLSLVQCEPQCPSLMQCHVFPELESHWCKPFKFTILLLELKRPFDNNSVIKQRYLQDDKDKEGFSLSESTWLPTF